MKLKNPLIDEPGMSDPFAENDLSQQYPDIVKEMQNAMIDYLDEYKGIENIKEFWKKKFI